MNLLKEVFLLYFIIMIVILSFNSYINIDNLELSNEIKLKTEISLINTCCIDKLPIRCSRRYTYSNNNIKNKIFSIDCSRFFIFNKATYNPSFTVRKSKILIAIHCHISLFYHRYVFRKIYSIYNNIQLLFFIGLHKNRTINNNLYKETRKHKDIVLFNFYCDYYKLCMLTYNFLEWVKDYQRYYDIIVKQDTDTFLNIGLAETAINNLIKLNTSFVLGKIWNLKDKKKRYPSGMSYIFLAKSINQLLNNINQSYIKCSFEEDMLFGFLSRKANLLFFDSFESFKFIAYINVPKFVYNINSTFMIHTLRVAEIAFLHYITKKSYTYLPHWLNKACNLHD